MSMEKGKARLKLDERTRKELLGIGEKRANSTDHLSKEEIILAIRRNEGFLSYAAKDLGVSLSALRKRVKNDEELQEVIEDCKHVRLDYAERKLFEQIRKRNNTYLLKFYLETVGSERGYIKQSKVKQENINISDKNIEESVIVKRVIEKMREYSGKGIGEREKGEWKQ